MKKKPIKKALTSDKWLVSISLNAGFLWLFIVFVLRRVFLYLQFDLVVLGILPSFFAGLGLYLLVYLKLRSRLKAAIVTFVVLSITEVIQLYTPRTFDPLDFLASALGIGCAELIRGWIEKKR